MKNLVCINGDLVSENKASISIFDRGFLYGDGVFETLRVYGGKLFRLPQHLWRLKSGCDSLQIRGMAGSDEIGDAVKNLVTRNCIRDGFVRILVTRGLGEVGLGIANPREPLWVIYAQEKPLRPEDEYTRGWRVILSTIPNNADSWVERTKTISRAHHVMAKAEAEAAGAHDAIMPNTNGHLTEGTTSNLFIVKKGRLLTPPITDGLLGGITRAVVLEVAHHLRIPAEEKHLKPTDLLRADEAFLTSTLVEIMPITEVDGKKICGGIFGSKRARRGHPGPLTMNLRHEFHALVRRELGKNVQV